MSISSLLNGQATKSKIPQATVVRRVVHVNQNISKPTIPSSNNNNTTNNNNPQNNNPIPSEEDCLTFSIISKLCLPKTLVEKINLLFLKLLQNKIGFTTVSKIISQDTQHYPIVYTSWQAVIQRKAISKEPLFHKISKIVLWFKNNQIPSIMCVNFIKFLSDSRQQQLSQIKLLSYLITNDFENFTPHCTSQLLQFALELFPYLSSSNFNVSPKPIENVSLATNLGIEDPNSPFIIPKRVLDVSLAMQRKLRLQKQKALSTHHRGALSLPTNVKFTPSHSQSLSDLPNNGTSFIFNFITKSTPVGHEGGSRPIPHHVEAAPAPTRDINELLERLEVLEHLRDEIIGFNIDINQLKYVIRDPGMKIYGPAWEEIESYLTSREVRQYVISRLRSLLPRIEDNHYNERTFSMQYLKTQPTNGFIQSIKPLNFYSGTSFEFPFFDDEVTLFLKQVILTHKSSQQKFPSVVWFINEILPKFQITNTDYIIKIFGNSSLANSLSYFNMLCNVIRPLFSPDSILAGTYSIVLESAYEKVLRQFNVPIDKSILSKTLKSILTNRTVIDDKADEISKYYGNYSQNFAQFYPIFSKLNHSTSWLQTSPHLRKFNRLAESFGYAKDIQTLKSYEKIYKKLVRFPSGERIVSLEFRIKKNEIFVEPID